MAVVDYFLKIEGIPGESQDAAHKSEIDILAWSWGESQTGTMAFGGGGGAGKVQMEDFQFTMKVNKSSPKLLLACATGQHLKQATLTARKAGEHQQDYFKFTLCDVLVTSYHTGDPGQSDAIPIDQFRLGFAQIEAEYQEQKADGSLGGSTKVKYNLKEMRAK
jgi:type VI secretion system secreted protein Hcp